VPDNGSALTLSPRVRALAAAAIQAVAFRLLNVRLTEPQALELTEIGDVPGVLRMLRGRLSYARAANGITLPHDSQFRIAVAEIVADAKGLHESNPVARLDFVRAAVTREQQHILSERATAANAKTAEAIGLEIRNSSPRVRAFFRQIDRVRQRRINHLRASIANLERCEVAIQKLDALFENFIRRAMKLDNQRA
jgi:hypothetical protein